MGVVFGWRVAFGLFGGFACDYALLRRIVGVWYVVCGLVLVLNAVNSVGVCIWFMNSC